MKETNTQIPDVVFIGYMKAGTEYLRSYFSHHPDLSWSRRALFFQLDDQFNRGREWYLQKFNKDITDAQTVLDVYEGLSTGYITNSGQHESDEFYDPSVRSIPETRGDSFEEIAARIHEVLPNAKILLTIREQVNWIRSNYLHHLNRMPGDRRSFTDFIRTFVGKNTLLSANYHRVIENYYEKFGEENVYIQPLETINDERSLKRLCEFLKVDYVPFSLEQGNRNKGRGIASGRLHQVASTLGVTPEVIPKRLRTLGSTLVELTPFLTGGDVLAEDQKKFIESMYSLSNQKTDQLIEPDLKALGYAV